MISMITLEHFKCFDSIELPLARLTILAGGNATGKSSAAQALVLLHQSLTSSTRWSELILNGDQLSLGTVTDVVDNINGRQQLSIGVVNDGERFTWEFEGERRAMSMRLIRYADGSLDVPCQDFVALRGPLLPFEQPSEARDNLNLILNKLGYITAERLGPRDVYPLKDATSSTTVGPTGAYAASVLHWNGENRSLPGVSIEGTAPTVMHQTRAWMSCFFPGCDLEVQAVTNSNLISLGFRTSSETGMHRPTNTGYGLSQVLPIIVSGVSAHEGDMLVIENPEVHLHPSGQSLMGEFLAMVASAGVQLLVETHSDHVLNGIRRTVKRGTLPPEYCVIHYFSRRDAEAAQVTSPRIMADGSIDHWPVGFFDQHDNDLSDLVGWNG
jgi:predicted ATPase